MQFNRDIRDHAQSLVDSLEGRDQWLASGMEVGGEEGYAELNALVPELSAAPRLPPHHTSSSGSAWTCRGVGMDVSRRRA